MLMVFQISPDLRRAQTTLYRNTDVGENHKQGLAQINPVRNGPPRILRRINHFYNMVITSWLGSFFFFFFRCGWVTRPLDTNRYADLRVSPGNQYVIISGGPLARKEKIFSFGRAGRFVTLPLFLWKPEDGTLIESYCFFIFFIIRWHMISEARNFRKRM